MFSVTLFSESCYAVQMSVYERERAAAHRQRWKIILLFLSLEHFALNYILVIYYVAAEGGLGALCFFGFFWQSL